MKKAYQQEVFRSDLLGKRSVEGRRVKSQYMGLVLHIAQVYDILNHILCESA